ncbi:unnamed protein product [Bursaphelenchus xylophilus]|uniref:(pine wood nematode) hypothetical protein n=1 Tax=Bursaphelenchus xylophilus TaxID=6326 RepID=A0A1I7SDR6_BURXY|nr:unnamed protein product [Bursaphelenchus xylophilus]CAG9084383.1 unnamed protein product [Bursaphelenchus xylophilus]
MKSPELHELKDLDAEGRPSENGSNFWIRSDLSALRAIPVPIQTGRLIKAHQPQYSASSLNRFCPSNHMPRIYARIGYFIGSYPKSCFCLSVILCIIGSAGLRSVDFRDNVRDGYTPITSRARLESNYLRQFMNSTGDPISTIMLLRAKDGGSMHRLRQLKEATDLVEYFSSNLTIRCTERSNCTFMDVCGSFCFTSFFVRQFYTGLKKQVLKYNEGKPLSSITNLTFPRGRSDGVDYQLEGNFFGVKLRPSNDTRPKPAGIVPKSNCSCESSELTEVKAVSYIDYIELIMIVFRGDFKKPGDEERMKGWEMGVYRHLRDLKTSEVEVLLLGNEIVDYEMKEDGRGMAPYFAAGIILTIVFVCCSVVADSIVADVMDIGKIIMAAFVILCPILSLLVTFGIFGWLGWRVNSVAMITPFLIMGIGVNDSFLILHAWHRTPIRKISLAQRMGLILEDVGPSITITTITDVTTFILGSLTPTEEISIFCYITAIALFWCYFFTLLLFFPMMVYCTRLEEEHFPPSSNQIPHKETRLSRLYHNVSVIYCRWIMHPATGIIVCILVVFTLIASIIGFIQIDSRLDTEKILPHDSPIREPHKLIAHKVWTDYYPVTVFVNKPVNLDDNRVLNEVNRMAMEFEKMEKCKGAEFTHLWVRDFEKFKKDQTNLGDMFDFEDSEAETTTTLRPRAQLKPYYNKLESFLNQFYYQHYSSFLKVDYSEEIPVRAFWFTVIYHNTTNWDEKIALMLQLRSVADQFNDLGVSVWEVNGMFVDQMLSLKSLTYYNGAITIVCMAIISIFFISQGFLIWLAVMSIASIALEVIGILSWWGLDLDPVTLCAFLMSVGMSVDFTAHIAYNLKLTDTIRVHHGQLYRYELQTRQHKVIATLEAVGWPTVQAGVSTVVCILPLILLQNYIPLVFVKTISLVVIFGLLHGLLIVPSVYTLSWQCLEYLQKVLGCESVEDKPDLSKNRTNGVSESLLVEKPVNDS